MFRTTKRRVTTSERKIREIMTKEHRPRETHGLVAKTRWINEKGTNRCGVELFSVEPTSDARTVGSAKYACSYLGSAPANQFGATSGAPRNSAWQSPSPVSNGPDGRFQKMLVAGTHINSRYNKPDGAGLFQITNGAPVVMSATLEDLDQRSDRLVPTRLPCQQPQKQVHIHVEKSRASK